MKNKYTLYFKGKNKYGHDKELPIISLYLNQLDTYLSNYTNYVDLFNNLPVEVSSFIDFEFGGNINFEDNNDLVKHFYIKNESNVLLSDTIFEKDIDVLYINSKELTDLICNLKMSYSDFQSAILNISSSYENNSKYEFFSYLYNTYVKDKPILGMIDTYEINHNFGNLNRDDIFIAAIATDVTNIKVLIKKISQTVETRRSLAIRFKTLFIELNKDKMLIDYSTILERKNKDLDMNIITNEIINNVELFKKEYFKEYQYS